MPAVFVSQAFFVVIARSPGSDSTEVLFPLISFKIWYLTVFSLVLYRYIQGFCLFWGES